MMFDIRIITAANFNGLCMKMMTLIYAKWSYRIRDILIFISPRSQSPSYENSTRFASHHGTHSSFCLGLRGANVLICLCFTRLKRVKILNQ